MSCKYKSDCPASSGWCEGPQQDFARCIPFLINTANHWKLESQKQAASAGELRIAIAERLEAVRTKMAVTRQNLAYEDNEFDRVILEWKLKQLQEQDEWLVALLYGKKG